MQKTGVLIRCYSITDYLPFVLKNYAWVDKIVVMNYRFKSAEPRQDDTEQIVNTFQKLFRHNNLIFEKGEGVSQHEIFNKGIKYLSDCATVFISDADEFIALPSMKNIVFQMEHGNHGLGYCRIIDYAFDFYHRFNNRHFNPTLVAINPKYAEFVKIRIARSDKKAKHFEHKLYHFGFVLPPKTLKWKLQWESKEEGVNIVKGITETEIVLSEPPEKEIMELLGEI